MVRRRLLVAGLGMLLVLLALYAAAALWLTLNQRRLVYYPDAARIEPAQAGLPGFTAVTLTTDDNERIVGWWRPPPARAGVVLYLHGNAGNLAHRASRLRDIAEAGLGVLAIDYRGYGGSSGTPSEAGLGRDAVAAHRWIGTTAPGASVTLFGESLGSGVAVALADRRPVAGLVLDSPFASVLRLGERAAPWLPVRMLMRERYDSEARIGGVDAPVLIVHCTGDREIPFSEGRRLFAAAEAPKDMVAMTGCGHIQTWRGEGRSRMLSAMKAWTTRPFPQNQP